MHVVDRQGIADPDPYSSLQRLVGVAVVPEGMTSLAGKLQTDRIYSLLLVNVVRAFTELKYRNTMSLELKSDQAVISPKHLTTPLAFDYTSLVDIIFSHHACRQACKSWL